MGEALVCVAFISVDKVNTSPPVQPEFPSSFLLRVLQVLSSQNFELHW